MKSPLYYSKAVKKCATYANLVTRDLITRNSYSHVGDSDETKSMIKRLINNIEALPAMFNNRALDRLALSLTVAHAQEVICRLEDSIAAHHAKDMQRCALRALTAIDFEAPEGEEPS